MSYSFICEICGKFFGSNTLEDLEKTFYKHLTKCHTREEILKLKEIARLAVEDPEGYRMLVSDLTDLEYQEHVKRGKSK